MLTTFNLLKGRGREVGGPTFPEAGSLKIIDLSPCREGGMGCRNGPIWDKYVTS